MQYRYQVSAQFYQPANPFVYSLQRRLHPPTGMNSLQRRRDPKTGTAAHSTPKQVLLRVHHDVARAAHQRQQRQHRGGPAMAKVDPQLRPARPPRRDPQQRRQDEVTGISPMEGNQPLRQRQQRR